MDLLEFTLIFPVIITLYNLQQIKMALKYKGYTVDAFKGLLAGHFKFKELLHAEADEKLKLKHRHTLNGLYFSLLGVVLFGIMILRARLSELSEKEWCLTNNEKPCGLQQGFSLIRLYSFSPGRDQIRYLSHQIVAKKESHR